jgi:hypothetical protein
MNASSTRKAFPGSTPTGRTRTFLVTVSKTVEITVDEAIIAQGLLPDNPIFGASVSEKDVVEHLAFNLIVNDLSLPQIDGFANCDDESACVAMANWDVAIEQEYDENGEKIATAAPATRSTRRRK